MGDLFKVGSTLFHAALPDKGLGKRRRAKVVEPNTGVARLQVRDLFFELDASGGRGELGPHALPGLRVRLGRARLQ